MFYFVLCYNINPPHWKEDLVTRLQLFFLARLQIFNMNTHLLARLQALHSLLDMAAQQKKFVLSEKQENFVLDFEEVLMSRLKTYSVEFIQVPKAQFIPTWRLVRLIREQLCYIVNDMTVQTIFHKQDLMKMTIFYEKVLGQQEEIWRRAEELTFKCTV